MLNPIYFDANASTPVAPEVKLAMLPYLEERFGNPSSNHRFGEAAKRGLDLAREQVAALVHCRPERLVFTSGGSEANNLAIWSAVAASPHKKHLLASAVEHASVLAPLHFLRTHFGYEIELLPVDSEGGLDLERLAAAIRPETALVSLLGANNETGVLWPVARIGAICREKKVMYHCDAVQMAGKMPLDLHELPVDYLSISAHKISGPKGSGALYVRRTAPLTPLVMGGGQEGGRRAGTENIPGIVGFGKACQMAAEFLPEYADRLAPLRARLESAIRAQIPAVRINGGKSPRLANTSNISCEHCAAAAMLQELDERGVAVSAHAACHSGDLDPSHVLSAMHVPETYLHGSIRVSLHRGNTMNEVETFVALLAEIVRRSRGFFTA